MRQALAGLGAAAIVLVVVGAAPAAVRGNPDARTLALNTAKVDLTAALTLEQRALRSFHSDNRAGMHADLREAIDALNAMTAAAKELTTPNELRQAEGSAKKRDPWGIYSTRLLVARQEDEKAVRQHEPGYEIVNSIGFANRLKEDLLDAVTNELAHPDCRELINLQGPIEVNGVPQGHAQLTVELACKEPIKSIYVDVPGEAVAQAVGDTGDTASLKSGSVVQVSTNGAKTGGVTLETNPEAAAGEPLDVEVVPIAGDSVEYFPEVM